MKYLYFSAPWCSPCRTLGPIMDKVKSQGVPVEKIDIDQNQQMVIKYNILNIPTVILVDNSGKEFARSSGVQPEQHYLTQYANFNS